MTDLWSKKKKKVLTRKITCTYDSMKPNPKEEVENLLPRPEELTQESEAEELKRHSTARCDHENRLILLQSCCNQLAKLEESMKQAERELRHAQTRFQHPTLQNLNRIVPWVNQKLSSWHDPEEESPNPKVIATECLQLLTTLNAYIKNLCDLQNVTIWTECKKEVLEELNKNLDILSYTKLINIEKEMSYLNADMMYYQECNEFFKHCIWTPVTRTRNGKDEKFPLSCNFKKCGVIVNLPKSFSHKRFTVRCLLILNDYFSNSPDKQLPQFWRMNLLEYNKLFWQKKELANKHISEQTNKLKKEREKRDGIINTINFLTPSVKESPVNPDQIVVANMQDKFLHFTSNLIDTQKAVAHLMQEDEKLEMEQIRQHYQVVPQKVKCNLRMYHIIGGVYHLDLVKLPPQPKLLKDGATLRMIIGEDRLQYWHYLETYEPPNMKPALVKQSMDDEDEDLEGNLEDALRAKLISLTIKLPDQVIWFDSPIPVLWDPDKNHWTQEYIYEVKFNEEKQTLSFRTGKMTAFGLAVFKYNILPFQSWELRAVDSKSEVLFALTTSILMLEFIIRPNEVCLTILENTSTSALQELIGIFFEPPVLVEKLRKGGVNIFPSDDAFLYIDGVQMKHRVTEHLLYYCMAKLCRCYRFSWSRWNLMAGYKKFISHIQHMKATKGNELLVVTDQRAMIVDAIVDIHNFEDNIETWDKVFPDLFSLAKVIGPGVSEIVKETDVALIKTVYYILSQTKIMSYS